MDGVVTRGGLRRLGVLFATILLAACGAASATPSASPTVAAIQKTVTMSVNFSPQSLDPATGSWQLVQLGIGETLTRLNRQNQIQPWLAVSWTHSADFTTWTFTLRKGVKFFDGASVDATAVAGALTRNVSMNTSAKQLLNPAPGGITAISPNIVQIQVAGPDPALNATVSQYNFVIYDPANLSQIASSPSLTGAFEPTAFTAGASLDLERNNSYWGPKALVPGVHVLFQTDGNTRTNSLLGAQADLAYQVPFQSVSQIQATAGFTVKSVLSAYQDFLILNTKLPQLSDPAVRDALSESVDRSALAQLDGNRPAVGPISPVYPFALTSGGYGYNQADAASKLDAAGWHLGADGVRTNGTDRLAFTMVYYSARPELVDMATVIQSEMKQIGVAVALSQVPCCAAYRAASFQAGLYANNTAPTGDAESFLNPFFRAGNMANFSSPTLDADLTQLSTTSDPTQRTALVKRIQRDALAAAPYIFLTVPVFNTGLDNTLKTYEPYNSDYYVIDNQVEATR